MADIKTRVSILGVISTKTKALGIIKSKVIAAFPAAGNSGGTINVYIDGALTQTITSADLDAEDINITI